MSYNIITMPSIHPSNAHDDKRGRHTRPKLRRKNNIKDAKGATTTTTTTAAALGVSPIIDSEGDTNGSSCGSSSNTTAAMSTASAVESKNRLSSSSSPLPPSSSSSIDALLESTMKRMDRALQIAGTEKQREPQQQQQQQSATIGLLQGLLKNHLDAGGTGTSISTTNVPPMALILDKNEPQSQPHEEHRTKISNSNICNIDKQQQEQKVDCHIPKIQKVRGILKHETRYQSQSKNDTNTKSESERANVVAIQNIDDKRQQQEQRHQQQQWTKSKSQSQPRTEKPTTATMVKDLIVERSFPKADLYPNQRKQKIPKQQQQEKTQTDYNSNQIEGYVPNQDNDQQRKLSNSKSSKSVKIYHPKGVEPKTSGDSNNDNNNDNNEDNGNANEMMETEMEFKYMTKEEFESAVQVSAALGISVNEFLVQQEEIINSEKNSNEEFHDDGVEKVKKDIGSSDRSDNTGNGVDDYDDNNDEDDFEEEFFSFFGQDLEDDGEEEAEEQNPSSFILLWNALSKWITPKSINVLQKYRSEFFDKDHEEKYSAVVGQDNSSSQQQEEEDESEMNYHNSDIAASRCEGLMSMIKMNLAKSLSDLGYNSTDEYTRQIAHTRLGDFIQSFDFSEPMVKFDSKMWFALSVLLLDILLPKYDIAYEGKYGEIAKNHDSDDDFDNDNEDDSPQKTMPSSLTAVDLNYDEYVYLTRSAIPSLSKGSDR